MLPIEIFRLFAGKTLYSNKLHFYSREFITLKGIFANSSRAHHPALFNGNYIDEVLLMVYGLVDDNSYILQCVLLLPDIAVEFP